MRKGEGARRALIPVADLLEGRQLLSHSGASASSGSRASAADVDSSTPRSVPVVTDHPATTDARGVETPTDEATPNPSSVGPQIPLLIPVPSTDAPAIALGVADSIRHDRLGGRDELLAVAWGLRSGSLAVLDAGWHRLAIEPDAPGTDFLEEVDGPGDRASTLSRPLDFREARPLPSPLGSGLLGDFHPADPSLLAGAVDRLLDGLDDFGTALAVGVGPGSIPNLPAPLAWSIAFSAAELLRRRLRRLAARDDEDEDRLDPDRGPMAGFLGPGD
jgi:hypothetical protein